MGKERTGIFDTVGDVGTQRVPGSTVYDPVEQTYTVVGGGTNTWGSHDEYHYAAFRLKGDALLTVEARFLGAGVDPHRKWGLMFRPLWEDDSVYAAAAVHGDGLSSLQYRSAKAGETRELKTAFTHADVVQLERLGPTVIMRAARTGDPLQEIGRLDLPLGGEVYAGVFVCSHNPALVETAVFQNLRVDVAAAPGLDGYAHPSPSRLETFQLATGRRRVLLTSDNHFEAPNWSRDGKHLLYNQDGQIYRFPLPAGPPQVLDTGTVRANNNDHGLSSDGKWLALSSHTAQTGRKTGSQIYVVAASGGRPRQVTDEAPSYWHGWSPDGQTLVYCAERGGSYDIWSIGVNGGPETRLTSTPGLDDGPEFSPDGAWIYFNSTRSGLMKIWKMKPDGSLQQQVSHGDTNDWFAHPSPDGKTLVYVSYGTEVPAESHPRNERVTIRQQSLADGSVKVLAHVYGGQGTMNVPSWSPDGSAFAFVSYTYGSAAR